MNTEAAPDPRLVIAAYLALADAAPGGMICGNHERWLCWLAFIPGKPGLPVYCPRITPKIRTSVPTRR